MVKCRGAVKLRSFVMGLRSLDMFGFKPELSIEGEPAHTTIVGSICSLMVYAMIIFNTAQLSIKYSDGSKQNEKYNEEHVDRLTEEPSYFSDGFEIAIVTKRPIPEDVGKLVAYQLEPCSLLENSTRCDDW